jgi:hypothetical protein
MHAAESEFSGFENLKIQLLMQCMNFQGTTVNYGKYYKQKKF